MSNPNELSPEVKALSITNLRAGVRAAIDLRVELSSLGILGPEIAGAIDAIAAELGAYLLTIEPSEIEFLFGLKDEYAPKYAAAQEKAMAAYVEIGADEFLKSLSQSNPERAARLGDELDRFQSRPQD